MVLCTGGRYEWTEVTLPLGVPDGLFDLYLAMHGAVRLDWFRLEREPAPRAGAPPR